MATHSSILAWKIPWTQELGGLQSMGHKESDTTERLILSDLDILGGQGCRESKEWSRLSTMELEWR